MPAHEPVRVSGAPERLPTLFTMLEDIRDATWDAMQRTRQPNGDMDHLKIRMMSHTFNVLKGVILLLENDFWELALPLTRQMFDILLNLEELERRGQDGVERFRRFGALQDFLFKVSDLRYNEATGRAGSEGPTADDVEASLRGMFPEFVSKGKNGTPRWRATWHGFTTRDLADRSSDAMRTSQYATLFGYLSAFTHGAPLVVSGGFEEVTGRHDPFTNIEGHLMREDHAVTLGASLAVTFYLEVWRGCSPPVVNASPDKVLAWGDQLKAAMQER